MSTFTEFAETKNAADFKEIFTQTLAAKVGEALEAKKFEVAQNFFNTEEVEQVNEGPFSSGALKPTQAMLDKSNSIESHTTFRGKDERGTYTAKLHRPAGSSDHKEISRVYDTDESVDLDELDTKTLKSYVNKNLKSNDTSDKRDTGLYRATNKIAKSQATSTLDKKVKTLGNTSASAHKNPYEYEASRSELKDRGIHNFAGRRTRTEEVEYMDEAASDHGTESNPIAVKTSRGSKIGTVHYSPTGNKPHGIKGPHYVATHINRGSYADFEGKTSTQHWESPKGRSTEVRDRAIRSMKRAHERVKEEVEQVEECGMSSPILSKKPVWPAASKTVKGIVPKASK
jgi:hypothetical protein